MNATPIAYGSLRLTPPSGWTDVSTITLLGPPISSLGATLHPKANPDAPRASIVIKRQVLSAPVALDTFVEAQVKIMSEVMAELKTLARGETTWMGSPARWIEMSFKSGVSYVRQWQCFVILDNEFVALAASAPLELPFDEVRKHAEGLIAATTRA